MRSDVFVLGLRLSGRHCLVVGSGDEMDRRIATLIDAGAVVRVVSERPSEASRSHFAAGAIVLAERSFEEADLDGVWLAVLTDLDVALAARMFRATEERRLFFSAVDQPDFCTFFHLAIARAGDVTLAVATNGRAPALARRLREELERLLSASSVGPFVERLAALRERTPSAERSTVLGRAVERVRFTGRLEFPEDEGSAEAAPQNDARAVVSTPRRRGHVLFWLLGGLSLLVLGAVGGVGVGRWWAARGLGDGIVVRSTPSVIVAVRDLARLEGAEYRVERVISLNDKQSRFFGLVQAEDAILLVASGAVTAGVDLSALRDGDVEIDEGKHSARITLPSSTVLSARLDNGRTFVWKRDTDLLAERKEALETRAREEAERTLTAAAEEGGIVERSNDNVRRTVESLIHSLGYGSVVVAFRGPAAGVERK